MLTQLGNIILLIIPLVLLPILLSIALFKDNFELPFHWWIGFLLISLASIIFHALKIYPAVYCAGITILIIILSIWRLHTIKQQFLQVKELTQNIDFLVVIMITLVITISGFLEINTHSPPIGGDSFSIWLNKAKSIYNAIPYPALPVVNYPSLIPTFNAFVMRFTGNYQLNYGLYLGPIAYFFWVLSLLTLFKHKAGWVMTATVSSIALLNFDNSVISGYQDIYIMMCASMSSLALLQINILTLPDNRVWSDKTKLLFWVSTFFAGMLALIKSEGAVLGMIIVAVGLLVYYPTSLKQLSQFLKNKCTSIITFIFLVLLWPIILYTGNVNISNIQGNYLTLQTLLDIPRNTERVFIIWPYFINYFRETSFILILSIGLSILSIFERTHFRKTLVFLWLIWIVHSIFIVFIFLSTRAPLIWHLETSFNRLLSHHAFIYPLIIVIVIEYFLDTTKP